MPPKSKRVLPGKRYPLNMRTTKELRDKIEAAATASGRSLVQEVEFRLEQSFAEDPLTRALHGDSARALRLIALAMQYETAADDGTSWKDDSRKAEAVRTAINSIISKFASLPETSQPEPEVEWRPGESKLSATERGRYLAKFLLERAGLASKRESK